ncbi:NAD(P)/FAD-dependent oxidoreductase [Micromonospora sp. NPDC048871]|uniref:NAD(P)/FAD-dependent oxidoreductase n=1 Tax=unclassified Micromonospora TaxID=2617518 RepID=UPI002E157A4A|nr:FAD-binding oxidoreductase [Micromonospora sp. NBC_01739]
MPAATPTGRRVLIVGAGVVGLLTALECARRGDEVTVLDQGPIPNPAAASFDQHRVVRALHLGDPAATRAAAVLPGRWTELQGLLATPIYRRVGVLVVQSLTEATDNLRLMRAAGIEGELLGPRQLRQRLEHLTFPGQAAGLLEPGAGVLLARRVLTGTTRWLRQHHGVRLLPYHRVVEVDPAAATVTLAGGSSLAGDLLFVAAGAWSRSLLAGLLPTPVTLYRQSMLYQRPDPAESTAWDSTPVVLLRTGPQAGGWLLPPGADTDLKVSTQAVCRPVERIGSRRTPPSRRRVLSHLLSSMVAGETAPAPLRTRECYYLADQATGGALLATLGPSSSPTWAYAACGGGGFKAAPLIAEKVAGLRAPPPGLDTSRRRGTAHHRKEAV